MGLFHKIDAETYRLIPQNNPPPPPPQQQQQLTMTSVFIKEESQSGPSGIQIFPQNNPNPNIQQQMAPPPPPPPSTTTGQFQFQVCLPHRFILETLQQRFYLGHIKHISNGNNACSHMVSQ